MAITFREDAMRFATSRLQGEVVVTSHVLLNILTAGTVILLALLCITATAIHVPVVVRGSAKIVRVSDGGAMTPHVRDAPTRHLIGLQVDARFGAVARPGQSVALGQDGNGALWSGQVGRVVAQSVARGELLPGSKPLPAIILLRPTVSRSLDAVTVIPVGTSLGATIVVGRQTPFEWLRRAITRGK